MCGVSGAIVKNVDGFSQTYWKLFNTSEIRGQDGSGITVLRDDELHTFHSDKKASEANLEVSLVNKDMVIGQNRLAVFGLSPENNQPITSERFSLVHNGNLFNFEENFVLFGLERKLQVDTELILRMIEQASPSSAQDLYDAIDACMTLLDGNMACLLLDRELGVLAAFTKFKPLYVLNNEDAVYFFSTDRIGKKVFKNHYDFESIESGEVRIYGINGVIIDRV